MSAEKPAIQRVLLKLSGEALMGDDAFGINRETIQRMVQEVAEVTALGVEVAVVIGGGNIFRGMAGGAVGMDRATADYMGMLATVLRATEAGIHDWLIFALYLRQEGLTANAAEFARELGDQALVRLQTVLSEVSFFEAHVTTAFCHRLEAIDKGTEMMAC